MMNHDFVTDQKSPNRYYGKPEREHTYYQHMFLEDFCLNFAFDSGIEDTNSFFKVLPLGSPLSKWFRFPQWDYLEYEFGQNLSWLMRTMVINGKAYAERIICEKNCSKEAEGIERGVMFKEIRACQLLTFGKRVYFISRNEMNRFYVWSIAKEKVVIFDLKDMGFKKSYFQKMIKKLDKISSMNIMELLNDTKLGQIIDFNERNKYEQKMKLKLTQECAWCCRDYSNPFLSETYLLYRVAKMKKIRAGFLNYFLEKINKSLDGIKEEYQLEGVLSYEGYEDKTEYLIKHMKGELSTSELSAKINGH